MASPSSLPSPFLVAPSPSRTSRNPKSLRTLVPGSCSVPASLSVEDFSSQTPAKLVTFLGKGGSGKTTAAVLAAQHYAVAGLSTCLVLHSQDPTAEFLLNRKIGTTPVKCSHHLSAVRLETTKMLLEPLNWLKQADAHLNTMQGVLEGIVGEELGVLPGMDSVFSAYRLERFLGFLGNVVQRNHSNDKFDIIIYDGISTEEMLRIIGASSTARLYLKYMRGLTEKTDFGRLVGPSFMRLVGEALNLNGGRSHLNGKPSSEIWDAMENILERGSSAFAEPRKFGCYLAMDPNNPTSVSSALRYWGCAIQAGVQVSGAFFMAPSHSMLEKAEEIKDNFSPLPTAFIPHLPIGEPMDWNSIVQHVLSGDARAILSEPSSKNISFMSPIKYDRVKKSVTLFMPGFDKLEIKLYQYRGGTELLVEAGDQRRVIQLPPEVQGKVGGAKLINRNLVITMQ